MDPVTLGILAGSAGLGYLGSQQAASAAEKASSQALAQEEALRAQALQMIQSGVDPSQLQSLYDVGSYDPMQMEVIEGFDPLAYQYGGDVDAQTIADSPEARAMQMSALAEMQGRADEGLNAQDKAQFMLGQMRTGETARGREEAVMESLQARGMGGSGIESSLRQQANQDAIEMLAMQQAQQAQAAAQQRAQATQDMFGMSGALRSQDIGVQRSNADILNQFALENSRRAQEINNMNISQQNQAQQDLTNQMRATQAQNVSSQNQAQMMNQDRQRQNIMDIYGAQTNRAQLEAGSLLGGVEGIRAKGAADAASQAAKWKALGQVPGAIAGPYVQYQAQQASQPQPQPSGEQKLFSSTYQGVDSPNNTTGGYYG